MTTNTAPAPVPATDRTLRDIAATCQALVPLVGENEVRAAALDVLRSWWSAARRDTRVAYAMHTSATNYAVQWKAEDAADAALAASDVLDAMSSTTPDAPEGMHRFGGVIFKVQVAVNGSGRKYAKALLEDGNGGWAFEYARGAVRNLSERTLLTLAEAKEFGALYGTCCVCGRTLTNEESIEAGIGPVCAEKF